MTPEQLAAYGVFLKNKAELDHHMTTGQPGSAGSVYGGPPATELEQAEQEARIVHFVATSGGTETFPKQFSSLRSQQNPHASYVGTLPDSNAPRLRHP